MNSFTVGVNTKIIGKCDPDQLSYSKAWSPALLSLPQLADHISHGHPWMPARLDEGQRRFQHYANHAELLALDVDSGLTIAQAMAHPVVAAHCGLGIETASSGPELNKFRLVFVLPRPVEGWQTIRICNRYLAEVIGTADPSCKDASRYFFGAPDRKPFLLNESATLPASFVEDAIAWHDAIEAQEKARAEQARRAWEEYQRQHPGQDTDALLLGALNAISPECDYNTWLAIGMALAGMGDQWLSVWDSWSAGASSYKPGECDRKWQSFRGKRPAPEVVFGIAKKHGWRFPQALSGNSRPRVQGGDRPLRVTFIPPAAKGEKTRAKDTKELRRRQTIERAQAVLNQALPPAHRETEGGYLPELPPLLPGFGGYAIDAGLGAGKTTAIGRDIVDPARDAFGFTLGLGPRNSLLAQTAEKHGLVHIREFKTDSDSNQALGLVARDKGGLECCINSLPRAAQHIPDRSTLVVDEAMATLTEAFEGGTLKGRYSTALSLLFDQVREADAVHIAESGLDAATLDMVQRVRGERLMVIRHHGTVAPWRVHLATGSSPNGMFAQMFEQLNRGERVWLVTTSLDEATALDLWARDNGINSMLITGETNEDGAFDDFFSNPDPELEQRQTQLLITTQSAQTGLSVEQYHFDAVYGYAPGFPVEVVYQMLGRYRQPCPRYVWVPAFIPPSRWEQPRKASALAEIKHEVGQWAARGFTPAAADPDQALIDDYLASRWEKAWAQKVIPGQALTMMLERAGHTVTPWELAPDEATKAIRAAYREKLARRRSEGHAGLEIDPEIHTAQWAKAKRDDGEATYRDRCIIRKLSTLEKFPGVDWDNPEIWYQAWFVPRQYDGGEQTHGPIGAGAGLWAECSAVDLLQGKAGDEAAVILAQRLRSIKLLPDYGAKLAILAPMRPLCEQILAQGTTAPGCPLVRRLAAMARALGDDLYRYLRIVAGDDHSDQAIAHKILRKFGLTVARTTYRKVGRTRQWSYTVAAPPLWQALVDARQIALDALRGKAHSGVTDLLEESFNKSVTPPPGHIPPDTWQELRALLNQAMKDGAAAIADLKDMVLAAFSPQLWEVLNHAG